MENEFEITQEQARAYVSNYEQIKREEAEAVRIATEACVEAINGKVDISDVFAQCLDRFRSPALNLQWIADKFWGLRIAKLLPEFERIYKELVDKKITRKNKIDFNDADDTVFYLPCKTKRVFVHTGQNFNFIYVWDKDRSPGFRRLHIRQFYDVYDIKADPEYLKEEEDLFKKKVAKGGYKQAIIEAQGITETWADDYKGNPYPFRYSLKHYIDNDFEMKYGDARDYGYIASWEEFGASKVESSLRNHTILDLVETCFVPCIIAELFENEKE